MSSVLSLWAAVAAAPRLLAEACSSRAGPAHLTRLWLSPGAPVAFIHLSSRPRTFLHNHSAPAPWRSAPDEVARLRAFSSIAHCESGKVKGLVTQSCLTPCQPMDCSPPGSSVHGISQARILEWVVIPSSRGSSQLKDQTHVLCIAGGLFTSDPSGKPN